MKLRHLIISVFFLASVQLAAENLTIAENGVAKAGILIPENAKSVVKVAADELADYLKKITGAEFMVGTTSKYKTNFKLGFGDPKGLEPEEFIIRTNGNDIEIFGHDSDKKFAMFSFYYYNNHKGTLQGVYYFLEQLGVRWPIPGMDHVPEQKTLVLKPLDIRFKPYFRDRQIGSSAYRFVDLYPDGPEYCKDNEEAMRWYMRIGESPRQVVMGCHSEHALGLFKDPEWQSDVTRLQLTKAGKRDPNHSCWTHPDIKKMWIQAADGYFSGKTAVESGFKYNRSPKSKWPFPFLIPGEFMVDPMDHGGSNDGRCYCERCQDFRKNHPCPDDTELLWAVIGDVADFVAKKHPGNYITTLVYSPKRQVPSQKLPQNVRVRVCLSGPKIGLNDGKYEKEFETIHTWYEVTGNKVPLWTYHCVGFGNAMPHIVETYPHLIKKYVMALKGIGDGMYMESHSLNHTRLLLDTYIFHRLMRNPDLDIEKELDEYFRILYGPAHQEAQQFYHELETVFADFWHQSEQMNIEAGLDFLASPWQKRDFEMQKKLWTMAYTAEKLAEWKKLVEVMEQKTAGTRYAKPVRLLRRYIYDGMVAQRQLLFGKEELRRSLEMTAARIEPGSVPTEEQWKNAPVNRLIPALPYHDKLKADGRFQLISDGKTLSIRAELDEEQMDEALVKPGQKTGSIDIWKDNCVQFYIASMQDNFMWQVIVNHCGHWSSRKINQGSDEWTQLPGCKVTVKQEPKRWIVYASIPLQIVNPSDGEMRLNMVRERHIRKSQSGIEYSTTSPLAMYGLWQDPKHFATVTFAK